MALRQILISRSQPAADDADVNSQNHFWGGCFWYIRVVKTDTGCGLYVGAKCDDTGSAPDAGKPRQTLYGTKVSTYCTARVCKLGMPSKLGKWCKFNKSMIPWLPLQVQYTVHLNKGPLEKHLVCCNSATFAPCSSWAWGTSKVRDPSADSSPPLTWDASWSADSPFCRNGVVRGRITLAEAED